METMEAGSTAYRRVVLAMLLLVYTFNFIDRQILGILAQSIKADLHLTDKQLGQLGGLAFALLFSTLAIPLAWLADRTSRTWVITGSLAVWSLFTALCGRAAGFGQLFLYRVGVGVGEAGGVAPSYALIAGYFPKEHRARALAIYSLGIPIGSAAGYLLGGYIAKSVDWRAAFMAIGVAGIVLAPLFRLVVREPRRGTPTSSQEPVRAVFAILARKPAFWLLALGAAAASTAGYGLGFWNAPLLQRSFAMDIVGAAQFLGALLLIGGTIGIVAGGWLGDRLGSGDRAAYPRIPAIGFILAVPLFAAGLLARAPSVTFACWLIPQALVYFWFGPVLAAVQHLVPAHMRATASATFLLVNNLIGLGVGPWAIGAASDALTPSYGNEALRYAMVGALIFYVTAAILMALAARPLRRAWVEDAPAR